MNEAVPARLDLAQARRMVDAALDGAHIGAGERERLACAKSLLRLEPPPGARASSEDFAAALQDIGRD